MEFHLLSCLSPFFLSRLESIFWIPYLIWLLLLRQQKMAFSCYGIFYLYFESLGLDITSVILNRFKMAATYPLRFLSIKESYERLIPVWYTFDRNSFINPNKSFKSKRKFCWNWLLLISISKIYLRSWNNLLIDTNPRSLPLRNESIISSRAPLCTIYLTTQLKLNRGSSRTEQIMSSQEHLIFLKMMDIKIHSRSCPSSRTLLSTTSF